ncbi:hypothetical protein [Xanthobacter autotrophicus]
MAVVPLTEGTLRLAGIEIALVGSRGEVMDAKAAEAVKRTV